MMTRTLAVFSVLALAAWVPLVQGAEEEADIFAWTDREGVTHFSDAPPTPSGESTTDGIVLPPAELTEDTPVPTTLNEFFGVDAPPTPRTTDQPVDGVIPTAPRPGQSPATTPIRYQPGSGDLPGATSDAVDRVPVEHGGPGANELSVEALEALDPVWFRGNDAAEAPEVYVDENGPFTIGEMMGEQPAPPAQRCASARRDLEVLRDSWPVYRDQSGGLRFQWERDPYRGARRYLDERARAGALAEVRQTLRRDCEIPDDPAAQNAARDQLLQTALCEAERAELAAMQALNGNGVAQSFEDKRGLVATVCGETAPPTFNSDSVIPTDSAILQRRDGTGR